MDERAAGTTADTPQPTGELLKEINRDHKTVEVVGHDMTCGRELGVRVSGLH